MFSKKKSYVVSIHRASQKNLQPTKSENFWNDSMVLDGLNILNVDSNTTLNETLSNGETYSRVQLHLIF